MNMSIFLVVSAFMMQNMRIKHVTDGGRGKGITKTVNFLKNA